MSEGPRVEGDLIATSHIRDIIDVFQNWLINYPTKVVSFNIYYTMFVVSASRELISSCLQLDCNQRLTLEEVSQQPWLTMELPPPKFLATTRKYSTYKNVRWCNLQPEFHTTAKPKPKDSSLLHNNTGYFFLLISIAQKFLPKWSEAAFLTMSHLLCIF